MAVTTPILYDDTSLFTYDNNLIEILNTKASLIGSPTYATSNPTLLNISKIQASALSGFTETKTASGSDTVQYSFLINSSEYYWNGSAWVAGDGTYAKSNSASTINTNCTHSSMNTLLTGGGYVQVKAFLHSATGATTPSLFEVDVTYTFAAITPPNPKKTVVFLYLQDILGAVIGSVQGAELSVKTNVAFKYGAFVILPFVKSTAFDSNGYAQLTLDETQTPGYPVNFSIRYVDGKGVKQIDFVPCIIPNIGSTPLMSITVPNLRGSGTVNIVQSTTLLPIAQGGTGEDSPGDALNALLPSQIGNAGKALFTDGANTEWETVSGGGGTPGGVDGNVQYNQTDTFQGDDNFFWDYTNRQLGVGTNTPSATLELTSEGGQGTFVNSQPAIVRIKKAPHSHGNPFPYSIVLSDADGGDTGDVGIYMTAGGFNGTGTLQLDFHDGNGGIVTPLNIALDSGGVAKFSFVGYHDMNSNPIVNLLDPVDPQDAATKNYVDTSAGYTPASNANWNGSPPSTVQQALDRIAAMLGPIT